MDIKKLESFDFIELFEDSHEDAYPYMVQELNNLRWKLLSLFYKKTLTLFGEWETPIIEKEIIIHFFEICVHNLNQKHSAIGTDERESLCHVLEAMGHCVELPIISEYVNKWRDW